MTVTDQLLELVDLDPESYTLTNWEIEFVDSLEKKCLAEARSMTPKQEAIVSRIYDDVFIHGKRMKRD